MNIVLGISLVFLASVSVSNCQSMVSGSYNPSSSASLYYGSRPGTCPSGYPPNMSMQCTYDQMCPQNQKCCPIGSTGFRYCANPAGGSGTGLSSRPGTCPVPTGVGTCILGCNADINCPGTQKCCSNGCGKVCTYPSSISGGSKPGTCPSVAGMFGSCNQQCSSDSGCSGNLKCCSNGCGTSCMNPSNGGTSYTKPGACTVAGTYEGGCTNQCNSDSMCAGTMKCCRNACANVCVYVISAVLEPYFGK